MRTTITLFLAVFFAIITSILLSGCVDNLARAEAEKQISRMLPELIGPAKSYTVRVDGKARHMQKGKIKGIEITGEQVSLAAMGKVGKIRRKESSYTDSNNTDSILLSRLEVVVKELDFDINKKAVIGCKSADWKAWLNETQLENLSADKFENIRNVKIDLKQNVVKASGKLTYQSFGINCEVDVKPEIREEKEVWLTPIRVKVWELGVSLPDYVKKKAESIINPVYKLENNDYGLKVKSVNPVEGLLLLEGSFDPTAFSKKNQ